MKKIFEYKPCDEIHNQYEHVITTEKGIFFYKKDKRFVQIVCTGVPVFEVRLANPTLFGEDVTMTYRLVLERVDGEPITVIPQEHDVWTKELVE
jgi:hypothetical protein